MRVEAIQLTPLQEGLIFFITGTILLIAALFACIQSSVEFSSGATVTAEIEQIQRETTGDGEDHHVVYVRYTYEGVTYDHIPLYSYSASMREGDSIELLINPANPRRVDTTWGMPFIFILAIIICSSFIVRGLLFIVHARPQRK